MPKPLSRQSLCSLCSLFALALCLLPAASQSQDASKLLNLLQNLSKPGAGTNAAPSPAMPGNSANSGAAGQAGELLRLLNQSLEQIDEPKEIEIGRQLAAVLLGSKPLHPDLQLQRYVNQLGRWISLQSARPALPWTFAVLDDAGFNAFAAPGGYVFVTRGLIDRVADESELAGILAHEINHVVGKHHLKAMQKTARAGLLTQALASQIGSGGSSADAIKAQMLSLGREIYSKGLDQADEFEADRNALTLSARAGFDPYGLVSVLQQLRGTSADNPAFALQLSTHPATPLRLDQIEQAMGTRLDAFAGKPSLTVAQRLARMPR